MIDYTKNRTHTTMSKPTKEEWLQESNKEKQMNFKDLVGKTVTHAHHVDNDYYGVILIFDDDTRLVVSERSQSGQLEVVINDENCGEGEGQ